MYTFSPVTPRILKMREQLRERVAHSDAERPRLLTEAYMKYENVPPVTRCTLSAYFAELGRGLRNGIIVRNENVI